MNTPHHDPNFPRVFNRIGREDSPANSPASSLQQLMSREVGAETQRAIGEMVFFARPDVSWNGVLQRVVLTDKGQASYREGGECNAEEDLSQQGQHLIGLGQRGTFFNMPCGREAWTDEYNGPIAPLARLLGYSRIVEVDLSYANVAHRMSGAYQDSPVVSDGAYHRLRGVQEVGHRRESEVDILTVQDELLGFCSKLEIPHSFGAKTFYLSGLESHGVMLRESPAGSSEDIERRYFMLLWEEIARLSGPGDLVICNGIYYLDYFNSEKEWYHVQRLPALGFEVIDLGGLPSIPVYRKQQ